MRNTQLFSRSIHTCLLVLLTTLGTACDKRGENAVALLTSLNTAMATTRGEVNELIKKLPDAEILPSTAVLDETALGVLVQRDEASVSFVAALGKNEAIVGGALELLADRKKALADQHLEAVLKGGEAQLKALKLQEQRSAYAARFKERLEQANRAQTRIAKFTGRKSDNGIAATAQSAVQETLGGMTKDARVSAAIADVWKLRKQGYEKSMALVDQVLPKILAMQKK